MSPLDRRLRALLRRGDPAADGRDPGPEEIAAWRRALGKAAPAASHRPALWPLRPRTAAAGAAVAGALLFGLWLTLPPPLVPPVSPEPPAGEPPAGEAPAGEAPAGTVATVPGFRPAVPATGEPLPLHPQGRSEGPPSPPPSQLQAGAGPLAPAAGLEVALDSRPGESRPAAAVSELQGADPARRPRTLQLVAPGGTRLVWTLNPHFSLPENGDST